MDIKWSEPMLSTREVCQRLKVSPSTLKAWRRIDVGPAWYEVGGVVRYSEADVDDWLASRRHEPKGNGQRG